MKKALAAAACAAVLIASCSNRKELNRQLIAAVSRGDTVNASELLSRGADPNAREENDPGRTALMIAAGEDSGEIAAILVRRGADVNAISGDGSTALMCASGEGNADIAKLLLSHGADLNAADNTGQTALIRAAADGQAEIIGLLASGGADLNIADRTGFTAVMRASVNGHSEITELLLKGGAKLTDRDRIRIGEAARSGGQDEEIIETENK